jgi:hypothetical protein
MVPDKFLVRLVRPVFQATYLEVEGVSENAALNSALAMAGDVPEDKWMGRFNPEDYVYDVHCVRSGNTEDGHPFSYFDYPNYGLLTTEEYPAFGFTPVQPWMDWVQPFAITSLFEKWIKLLSDERVFYYEEGIDMLEEILKVRKGTDKKVVFLKPPAERQQEIDLMEAVIDIAYVLREED